MNDSSLLSKLKGAETAKEVRSLIANQELEKGFTILQNLIDSLDIEIESDIIAGDIEVAMWKMSQSVIFEEVLTSVERLLIKSRVLGV